MTDKGEIVVVGVCIDCLDNTWLGRRQMQFTMQPLFHKTLMPTGAGREKKKSEKPERWFYSLWNSCCVHP